MGVQLASHYCIPELGSANSHNLVRNNHQGLLCHALQVHREAGSHTCHMHCSGHQGRLSHRGIGC